MVDTRFSVSVQIMMTLAVHSDELLNSDFLSKVLKTNPTFIRKIVSNLVEAGLVESFRGKGGGVKIATPPESINLSDIYAAATERKKLISFHNKPVVKACKVSCCIETVLDDVAEGIEDCTEKYLSKITLQDLLKKVK